MSDSDLPARRAHRARSGHAISRRRALARLGAAASGGLALPAFLERAVSAPPGEKVVTAHVGLGGRGRTLLESALRNGAIRVGGLADVDAEHLEAARERAGRDVPAVGDFRKLLERKDLDAVFVATPDHWHAGVTIAACRAGKDVYVEKPLSYSVAEGRAMVEAAREHERIVQVGINHRSAPYTREIVRIVRGGRIGKVREVKMWMWGNEVKPPAPGTEPPPHLDWDFWLGPAPVAAYHPDRVHFHFRWCKDYAGGYMTDWGVHMLNVVTFAMGVDDRGPDTVEATGEFAPENLYDFPVRMEARWEYREPGFSVTWTQPSEGGDVLPGQRYGMTFYGEDGELRTGFGDGMHRFYRGGEEAPLPREGKAVDVRESPGHIEDWLASIRSRELPIADVEIGHRTTLTCLLANVLHFSGKRRLDWDWREERFAGDAEEANALLAREPREGYDFWLGGR